MLSSFCCKAGRKTTDGELEEMLESGNPAIFTSGVSDGGGGLGCRGREGGAAGAPQGCGEAAAGVTADGRSLCGLA